MGSFIDFDQWQKIEMKVGKMLLCTEKSDGSQCVLLTVDKEIKVGTVIT